MRVLQSFELRQGAAFSVASPQLGATHGAGAKFFDAFPENSEDISFAVRRTCEPPSKPIRGDEGWRDNPKHK